jgi:N-acyl-D-amino-acid deacylase
MVDLRIRFASLLVVIAQSLTWAPLASAQSEGPYDIVIANGRVVDGTGAPWYEADVAIRDGKVVAIGRFADPDTERTIDAKGLIVAPGFIDMMGQNATPLLENPRTALNLLTQGVTTINAGEGSSQAPASEESELRTGWRRMGDYFQMLDLKGLPINVVQTVGHTQVRQIVMGDEDRPPRPEDIEAMQELVREGMEAGAIGVSTALIYPPAIYARTEEIAALAKVAGEYGGRYYTHMRNEGDGLLEAIDEALEIGKQGNTPVHIFHLKTAGQHNWGKMPLAIARIKAARSAGQQVTADIYPYVYNGLGIEALIHPRHFTTGSANLIAKLDDEELRKEIRKEMEETSGWENWFRHVGSDWSNIVVGSSRVEKFKAHLGKSVAEISKELGQDEWDTFFELVEADTFVLPKSMSEANKILAMQQEFVSFCTDVGPAASSIASHPRAYGAFPRLLSHYVRDLGAISLERAVAQASAAAANNVLAYDRGRIAIGMAADIIVFDYENLADHATPAEPAKPSQGIRHVIVNGEQVLRNGRLTRSRPGKVLRGPGYDPAKAPSRIVTGKAVPGFEHIDRLVSDFLAEQNSPGASLAITDQGRLVYARGFGYADVGAREPVEPDSLFRIASISKPITAVAIMQLVEQGKLELDQPVYALLDEYEPYLKEGAIVDERNHEITIRHLLQHRGGWDRDVSFDAMFKPIPFAESLGVAPPAGPNEVIRNMMGLPLDFDPGHRFAYSNYGYCLLGRVIEKLTGQGYEEYVKEHVLKPMGVTRMQVGSTRLEKRREGEVRYYDANITTSVFANDLNQRVPAPYGAFHLEAMDAHGGWIASAIDLVRFASALDNPDDSPLLKRESIDTMLARPEGLAGHDAKGDPKSSVYAMGWNIQYDRDGNARYVQHGGALAGTSTKLIHRHDGRNVAILFNSRQTRKTSRLVEEIMGALHQAIDEVKEWPEVDLQDDAESNKVSTD